MFLLFFLAGGAVAVLVLGLRSELKTGEFPCNEQLPTFLLYSKFIFRVRKRLSWFLVVLVFPLRLNRHVGNTSLSRSYNYAVGFGVFVYSTN